MNDAPFFIDGPMSYGDHADVRQQIDEMLEAAQAAGFIPKDRQPLEDDSSVLLALDNRTGTVIGAVVYYEVTGNRAWLDFLFVRATERRRGVGAKLLDRLIEVCREAGWRRILLGTNLTNDAMRGLARTKGFVDDHVVMGTIEKRGGE